MPGLYIHVPFCIRQCLYCDFYVVPLGSGPVSERLKTHHQIDNRPFLESLDRDFATAPPDVRPSTVYIGGGTPTELSLADLTVLLDLLAARFDLSAVTEFTVEANPGTLSEEKARLLFDHGVTRISLGAQSFDDPTLEFLGRIHNTAETHEAVALIRRIGFDNLNLDLLINLPGTDLPHLDRDIDALLSLAPEHASCYTIDYEPHTHLTQLRDKGFVQELNHDLAVAQYDHLRARLADAGLAHYELFNFARRGRHSRHNQATWRGGETLGFGPAAHSHWQGERRANPRSMAVWASRLSNGKPPHTSAETLDPEPKAREQVMTRLRQIAGVNAADFARATGFELESLLAEALPDLLGRDWVEWIGSGDARALRLHPDAYYLSNAVFEAIL